MLEILACRMHREDAFFNSPAAVRDYPRLKIAELELEVFSVIFLDGQHGLITTEEMFNPDQRFNICSMRLTSCHPVTFSLEYVLE